MKIEYDVKVQSVYLYLTDIESRFGIIDHSQEITEDILIDWMEDGTVFGIQITGVDRVDI